MTRDELIQRFKDNAYIGKNGLFYFEYDLNQVFQNTEDQKKQFEQECEDSIGELLEEIEVLKETVEDLEHQLYD